MGLAHAPAVRPRTRATPMAATKRNAASKAASSAEPDMEDLFAKHPGVRSAIERAPEARQALLEWYDANHRVLPWRRNVHSRHCEPTDARVGEPTDDPNEDADSIDEKMYWRLDLCGSVGAARDVPRDQYAYGVWVSEIMSQQTQIERVATYWLRWMAKWPTVHALANATQEEVNELWAGLGYYRRARFLLEGARHISASSDDRDDSSRFPSTFKALAGVPGVGPYTAAAVASIAFEEPVAAVDGNVIRVAARLAAARGGGDPAKAGTSAAAAVRAVANAMLARERPGDFNQAMMELGATVCAPRNPKCSACPVAAHCVGLELQTASVGTEQNDALPTETFAVDSIPEKEKKAPKREEIVAVRFVEARVATAKGDAESDAEGTAFEEEEHVGYLLTKREEGGLLGGLWEFPSARMETPNEPVSASSAAWVSAQTRIASRAFENLPFPFDGAIVDASDSDTYVGAVTHVFSHVRQTMHVTKSTVRVVLPRMSDPADFFKLTSSNAASRRDDGPEWRWVRAGDVKDAGLSSGVVKVHALVTKPPGGGGEKNQKKPKKPKKPNSNSSDDAKPKPGESVVEKMFAAAALKNKRAKTEP